MAATTHPSPTPLATLSNARTKWLKAGVKYGAAIERAKYWGGSMNTAAHLEAARLECRAAYSAYVALRD